MGFSPSTSPDVAYEISTGDRTTYREWQKQEARIEAARLRKNERARARRAELKAAKAAK